MYGYKRRCLAQFTLKKPSADLQNTVYLALCSKRNQSFSLIIQSMNKLCLLVLFLYSSTFDPFKLQNDSPSPLYFAVYCEHKGSVMATHYGKSMINAHTGSNILKNQSMGNRPKIRRWWKLHRNKIWAKARIFWFWTYFFVQRKPCKSNSRRLKKKRSQVLESGSRPQNTCTVMFTLTLGFCAVTRRSRA